MELVNEWSTTGKFRKFDTPFWTYLFYATCRLETQTVAPTLSGFQGIKRCVQYLASHPHKPIFYPYNYYDG